MMKKNPTFQQLLILIGMCDGDAKKTRACIAHFYPRFLARKNGAAELRRARSHYHKSPHWGRRLRINAGASECDVCGLTYDDFRTGYNYSDIYEMFWSGDPDPASWNYKRRNSVLGKWKQIKESMWRDHLYACENQDKWEAEAGDYEESPLDVFEY